ncbi:MAG: enoyl-CoA hydratase/isomerase family protein, partial [Salinirussus sp.]
MSTHAGEHGCVEVSISDGVADLRLTNPEKRNAFSLELAADLFEVTKDHLVENDAVRAVAITADGPVFSAGADVNLVQGNDPAEMDLVHDYRRPVFGWLRDGPVPTIAGAHGPIIGLGAGFFTAMDMRVVADDVRLWMPEV